MKPNAFKRALYAFPLAALLVATAATPAPASHDAAAPGMHEKARPADLRLAM